MEVTNNIKEVKMEKAVTFIPDYRFTPPTPPTPPFAVKQAPTEVATFSKKRTKTYRSRAIKN